MRRRVVAFAFSHAAEAVGLIHLLGAQVAGAHFEPQPLRPASACPQGQSVQQHPCPALATVGRGDYVAPDDVQAVLPQTIAHRLVPVGDAGRGAVEQVRAMVDAVPLA